MKAAADIKQPPPAQKAGGRIPSLTGLRWLAALSVFSYHSLSGPGIFALVFGSTVAYIFAPAGGLGVSFFFVLSGFVLAWSARPGDSAPKFWRRRFFKIFPNHWAVCAAVIVFMLATGFTVDLHDVPATLLLVQSWNPNFIASVGVNGVAWSLSCEVFFYLCFPLLLWLITKIRPSRLWWWTGGTVLVIFLIPVIATLLPKNPPMPFGPPMSAVQYWFVYKFPVTRMFEFIVGIFLARMVMEGCWIRIRPSLAWLAMGVGYVFAIYNQTNLFGLVAVTIIPMALLIPTVAMGDVEGRKSFASHPIMVWLGTISYAFYLLHRLVLEYMMEEFGIKFHFTAPFAAAAMAGAFLTILLLAALLYEFVEKPIYRRFADPSRRKSPANGRDITDVTDDTQPAPKPLAESSAAREGSGNF